MNGWAEYCIGDLLQLEYGKSLTDYRTGKGLYDVFGTNGKIGLTNHFLYDQPSVIIGRKGAYREIHFAKNPFFVIDTAFYTKNKSKEIDTTFMYYWFKNVDINAMDSGSAIPSTSREEVYELVINLPSVSEQKEIAESLSSIDDKIDLLHRQNKTLEQLAEILFRQWFVEEAKESWGTVKVSDVARINSRTVDKEYPYDEIEYLDTGSITEGVINEFQTFKILDAPSRAQRIVNRNDIVYSLVRPIHRHYGILAHVKPNTIVSTGFCVLSCDKINPYFIYLLLTSSENVEFFASIAEGSTSAYPSLKPSDIANFKFQMPPAKKLKTFSDFVENVWAKIFTNQAQIRTLTQLRDTLLPKLMNGEVRITP